MDETMPPEDFCSYCHKSMIFMAYSPEDGTPMHLRCGGIEWEADDYEDDEEEIKTGGLML